MGIVMVVPGDLLHYMLHPFFVMPGLVGIMVIYMLTRKWRFPRPAQSTQAMTPDTTSSLYPDRPIRPLPKRRLRERLSPQVAESIKYPPSTQEKAPLFYYPPFTPRQEATIPARCDSAVSSSAGRKPDLSSAYQAYASLRGGILRRAGDGVETGLRSTLVTRPAPEILTRPPRDTSRSDQPRQADAKPPPSAASSVDGYESFENTNNKKKRKIPSAGDSALNNGHSLNGDVSSLGGSSGVQLSTSDSRGESSHHGPPASYSSSGPYIPSGSGFSASARGRLTRPHNSRSPLRALSDGNGQWQGRTFKAVSSCLAPAQAGGGLMSSAMTNGEKPEKLAPHGQENMGPQQQHHSNPKLAFASSQFTFTCASQVPGTLQWPGQSPVQSQAGLYSHVVTEAPNRQSISGQTTTSSANTSNTTTQDFPPLKSNGSKTGRPRRKTRHRLDQELNIAARHRRQIAADNFYHNPPKIEDLWICEFCEYERIFGEPPRALIREYELKDRRHRQEEADRRRLLEKAKAKSRKGKKNGKAPGKAGNAAHQSPDQCPSETPTTHDAPPMVHDDSHAIQSDGERHDEDLPIAQASAQGDEALNNEDDGGGLSMEAMRG